jgi:hypothetical protein
VVLQFLLHYWKGPLPYTAQLEPSCLIFQAFSCHVHIICVWPAKTFGGDCTTGIIQSLQTFRYIHEIKCSHMYTIHSPCHFLPLLISPLATLSDPSQLTWNPPCCDRIPPPRSQVARKLTSPFPSSGSYSPLPEIPTPRGFPDPNIHSLGQHCEPDP